MKLPSPACYSLRHTMAPWRYDELRAEMVDLLHRYQVEEVIVIEDTEEFSHGHPTALLFQAYRPASP